MFKEKYLRCRSLHILRRTAYNPCALATSFLFYKANHTQYLLYRYEENLLLYISNTIKKTEMLIFHTSQNDNKLIIKPAPLRLKISKAFR